MNKTLLSQQDHSLGSLKASLLALEPRIMFDGAAIATGAEVVAEQPVLQETDTTQDSENAPEADSPHHDSQDSLRASLSTIVTPSDRREIVFIDTRVEDYQTLMSGIDANAEVVLLDATRDGLQQIAEVLQGRSGFDAIHLVSHGNQAELQVGTATLTLESMNAEYANELSVIGQALNESADFLIYGCNYGEGETGQAAAARLAQLTGADIAASTDLTGHASLGGDWDLELTVGSVETSAFINTAAAQEWAGLLNDITLESYEPAFSEMPDQLNELKSNQNWGQTFSYDSPGSTYEVDKIGLVLYRSSDATSQTITVSIRSSWNGAVIASGTIASTSLSTSESWVTIDLSSIATLNDNATYYIRVGSNTTDGKIWLGIDSSGTYSNGEALDKDGLGISGEDIAFRVIEINDAPVITNLAGDNLAYAEGDGAVVIDQGTAATVTDDSFDFDTGTLTVSFQSGDDDAEDVLSIRNQGTGAGQIGVSGSNGTYAGVTIGTFTGGSGGTNLVITLNSSVDATAVTALVKNITYENTDMVDPTTGARTVSYVLTDGDGGTSANYNPTVNIYNTNLGGDTSVSFQEGVDSYASTQDTFLREGSPSSSFGNDASLIADILDGNGEQALIKFENIFGSGAGQIPLGSTIISASLTFDVTQASTSSATIGLHRMLTTWSESSTWNSMTNGIQTDGTDAASTADATVSDPTAIGSITLTGLESTLQAWSDGATNDGWVIVDDNANDWAARSSEDGTSSLRPKLIVEYQTTGGDISTGLIGDWTFDVNANDSSGNSYNGTLSAGASIDTTDLTDQVGAGKLSLDGTDDYVDLTTHVGNFSGLTEGTIAAWIKTTDTGVQSIFSISDTNDAGSYIHLEIDNGVLEFDVVENGTNQLEVNTNISVNDGVWHHVAVTVNSSGNALYVDGQKITDLTYAVGSSSSTHFFANVSGLDAMAIGRNENSSGGRWQFDGLIDDVRVYNQALSVADVAALAAEAPVAQNDSASTNTNTAVNINLIANDTDLDIETITVLDVGNPTNGSVVNNEDGTVTYTPDTDYTGTDSFTYLTADLDDTVSYWRFDGNATDAVGSNVGTVTGTTTVAGAFGNALSFDEVDDKVVVSDFAINDEFSLSIRFKIDDNSGNASQYLYSHGNDQNSNSVNVLLRESGASGANMLRTLLSDTNDGGGGGGDLEFDIAGIIGDGQWHTYTLTVASGVGSKVYLDGVLRNSDSRGGDSINPTTDVFFGVSRDEAGGTWYGGELDAIQLFDRALNAEEVSDAHTGGSSLGTVSLTVVDPPVITNLAGDNLAYTEGDGAVVIDQGTAAIVTDSDSSDFDTGTLTLSFTAGSDAAEDVLAIRNQGTGAGQIGVSGSNVTYAGVTALVKNITYQNTDTVNPTTGARTVRYVLTDGDSGTSSNYDTTVTVSTGNDDPTITSNGGGSSANVNVAEGTTAVTTVTATDIDLPADTLTFSIIGGADSGRFSLNTSTGVLAFSAPPDFENPLDADTDNVYEVQVQASDGNGGTDTQTIQVTVTNVVETPPPAPDPEPEPSPEPSPEESPSEESSPESEQALEQSAESVLHGGPIDNISAKSAEGQQDKTKSKDRQFQTVGSGSGFFDSDSPFEGGMLSPQALQALQGHVPANLTFLELSKSASFEDQFFPLSTQLEELAQRLQAAVPEVPEVTPSIASGIATGTGFTFSAGYLIWLLRSGSFFTTLLTAVNSIRNFDPLPVLNGEGSKADSAAELAAENKEFRGIADIFDKPPSP